MSFIDRIERAFYQIVHRFFWRYEKHGHAYIQDLFRSEKDDSPMRGDDSDLDYLLHLFSLRRSGNPLDQSSKALIMENLQLYRDFVRFTYANGKAKRALHYVLICRHLLFSTLQRKEDAERYRLKATRLSHFPGGNIGRWVDKDLSQIKRELKKIDRDFRDRKGGLLDFSIQDVATFTSLASIVFLFGGYTYCSLVLSYFGIDISYFFRTGDYLASSMHVIEKAFLAVSSSMIFSYLGFRSATRETKFEEKLTRKTRNFILFLITVTSVVVPFGWIYQGAPWPVIGAILVLPVYVFSNLIAQYISYRVFKRRVAGFFMILAFLLFFSHVLIAVKDRVYSIENGEPRYAILLEDNTKPDGRVILISGTYVFLLNDDEKTEVIPTSRIRKIKRF